MNNFPAVMLIWQIAAGEAIFSRHQFIEREHIFIGLCKISDLLEKIKLQLNQGKMQGLDREEIEKEIAPPENTFASLGLDPTSLRRKVRALMGKGDYQHGEKKVVHRSEKCKGIFNKAAKLAQDNNSLLNPSYLLKAILEDPGKFSII